MDSIYHSAQAKQAVLELYDEQLARLPVPYRDRYVDTTFGKTHLIETGDLFAKPLLVFHGGNATTAYNLLYCDFLLKDFHIYAVDTIGHPGKSAERSLSPHNQDYGRWASEVITQLGYEKLACFGGSFGAGVLVKLMCVAPEKVACSALVVPAAIKNALPIKSAQMLLPMIRYWLTHDDRWFVKCLLPMALESKNITPEILETARCSIDNARVKTGMPGNESAGELQRYYSPVLVLAAEKDCLFPGRQVLRRAKQVWPQARTYLLAGRGHIHALSPEEKEMIKAFLASKA